MFTSWYGQASCTAGRASIMTGRIPIRSALSVIVVPGDLKGQLKAQPARILALPPSMTRVDNWKIGTTRAHVSPVIGFICPPGWL